MTHEEKSIKETIENGKAMYQMAREQGYTLREMVRGMINAFIWNLEIEREAEIYRDTHASDPFSFEDTDFPHDPDPSDLPF